MAATSPYSGNDYNAVSNFRPYDMPVNDIYKGLVSQDSFWKAGAARINQVYNSALDLKLSKEANIDIRNKYMEDADKQLTKLSTMNVADPSVQRQGFGLFKPLFQDQGIAYDDLATRHYDQVRNDAMSARYRNNGKEFSNDNFQYAMDGYSDFMKSNDRMAGKAAYQNRKDYEPYYDYGPEAATILKTCKPDQVSQDSTQGMNIVNYSNKGLSSVQLNGCLSSGMSEKGWRQMQIEGAVRYKNNPGALRDAYLPSLINSQKQLSEENAGYDAFLKNKNKFNSLTEAQLQAMGLTKDTKANPNFADIKSITPEVLDNMEKKKAANTLQLTNLNETTGKLMRNDFTPISGENYEGIAGHVFAKSWMDNFSQANAYINKSVTMKSDPAQLLAFRENREDARQEDSQTFQKELKQMEIEGARQTALEKERFTNGGKGAAGLTEDELNDARIINTSFGDKDVKLTNSYNQITDTRNKIASDVNNTQNWLLTKLRDMDMSSDVVSDADFHANNQTFKNWYNNFGRTLPVTDPRWDAIKQYEEKSNGLELKGKILKHNQDAIDAELQKSDPSLFNPSLRMKDIKPVTYNGTTITADDVSHAVAGGTGPLTIVQGKAGAPDRYLVNGKDVGDIYTPSAHVVRQLVSDVMANEGKRLDELSSRRDELAKTRTIVQGNGYILPELDAFDPKKPKTFKGNMMKALGVPDDQEKSFTVGRTDLGEDGTGGNLEVYIHPQGKQSDIDQSVLLKRFRDVYATTGELKPIQGDKYHFIITGAFPQLDKFNSPEAKASDYIAPTVRNMESRINAQTPSETTGLIRASRVDKQYELRVTAGLDPGTFDYQVRDERQNIVGSYKERVLALQAFAAAIENYPKR